MSNLAYAKRTRIDYSALLLPFYRDDVWIWSQHPQFEGLEAKQKSYVKNLSDDFRKCTNRSLREEIKFYGQCEIEKGILAIHSFHGHFVYMYQIFFLFMNAFHPEIDSMLDYDERLFEKEFTEYWISLGRTDTSPVKAIDSSMNVRVYEKYKSGTLGKIIHIPRDLREFLNTSPLKFDFNDDHWDIRLTPYRDKIPAYRPRHIISFDRIFQYSIKVSAKHYIYHKLAIKSFATCQDYLKGINLLSEYLHEQRPQITKLNELNRDIIESFLRYAKTTKRMTDFTSANRIGKVRDFFETCILLNLEDRPNCQLILDSDYVCRKALAPRFYTDDELRQFNEHISDLPLDIARMLFTIETVGMRVSELCTLKTDCLQRDLNNDYILSYYQHKSKRNNRVPINYDLAECLNKAIAETKANYGDDCDYVFTRDGKKPISLDVFIRHLNELSYRYGFVDRAGKPLRVKTHTFRGTVATNYINIGIDPNVTRMMIGQADMRSLKFYVEASEEGVLSSTKLLIEQQEKLIDNIGNIDGLRSIISAEIPLLQPLPNGACVKKGKCDHYNACYSCSMFRPSPQYLPVYRHQLQRAESGLLIATASGMQRLKDLNEQLVKDLQRIIKECEEKT